MVTTPQPDKTNEMITRQKRLEAAFNMDMVPDAHIRDLSLALTGV